MECWEGALSDAQAWNQDSVASEAGAVEFSAGDLEDFEALYGELLGVAEVVVRPVPAVMVPGEQGSLTDLITVACASGGAVSVLLEIVKSLLDSRGPGFTLKIRRGRERLEVTAENAEEALPVLKELLGGS